MAQKKIHLYIVNFVETTSEKPKRRICCIVHYTRSDARNLFIKWTKAKGYYGNITEVAVVTGTKSKVWKTRLNEEYIKKEEDFVDKLYLDTFEGKA